MDRDVACPVVWGQIRETLQLGFDPKGTVELWKVPEKE